MGLGFRECETAPRGWAVITLLAPPVSHSNPRGAVSHSTTRFAPPGHHPPSPAQLASASSFDSNHDSNAITRMVPSHTLTRVAPSHTLTRVVPSHTLTRVVPSHTQPRVSQGVLYVTDVALCHYSNIIGGEVKPETPTPRPQTPNPNFLLLLYYSQA